MSTINVAAAQPRRLLYMQEGWTLEIQRWQAIDRDLFAPVQSYITGPENILRYLSELDGHGHLVTQAEHILSQPGNPNTCFEAQDGHWIAQTNVFELSESRFTAKATGADGELTQVLQHLALLQQRLERLEQRLQGRIADNDVLTPSVRAIHHESDNQSESTNDEAEPISETG